MTSPKSSFSYQPFQEMKGLLKARSVILPEHHDVPEETKPVPRIESVPECEEKLFQEAMEGVAPIARENCVEKVCEITVPEGVRDNEDADVLSKLTDLVKYGKGFNVFDTPEYIEGTGYNVHPEVARRLHRGDYSIQAYVDLHGLTAEYAQEVFEAFMKEAVNTGKRGVLIVHGRGLSSPSEPVLKNKVVEWMTRGPWRKWVIAYCSARRCDGGAGATYVLLRPRPVSKRMKTRSKRTKKGAGVASK